MKTKHYKIKWINILCIILIIVLTIFFTNKAIKLLKWINDSNKLQKQIARLQTSIKSIEATDALVKSENSIQEVINKSNPYHEYQNINQIDIDFNELKNINQDIIGWIKINNTNVNYPFVQTTDNNYYLKHDIEKNYNTGGWLFLDYRNNINELEKNNIIYGHNRKDKTMFGSLENIFNKSWQINKENHFIQVLTLNYKAIFQVFSVYHLPKTSDYLMTNFKNDQHFNNFIETITKRSLYNFNIKVTNQDKILTLSTCYKENERMVLHAKLITTKRSS